MRIGKQKKQEAEQTEFYTSLLEQTTKLFALENGKLREVFSELEQYHRQLLEACLRITATMKSLQQSQMFIRSVSDKPVTSKKDLTDAPFLRYHLECYAIRVVTFKDVVLKLINRTYKLGIKENIGLERNMLKHATDMQIKNMDILLKGLKIIIHQLEEQRHAIAHGNYHDDIDLILLEVKESILEKSKKRIPKAELEEYTLTRERVVSKNYADMVIIEYVMKKYLLLAYTLLLPVKTDIEKTLDKPI